MVALAGDYENGMTYVGLYDMHKLHVLLLSNFLRHWRRVASASGAPAEK